ncbi:MAG: exo-beta-N-acetylmuramidase NamZ domain-containing protein [bacterium]
MKKIFLFLILFSSFQLSGNVETGLDIMEKEGFSSLKNKNVALLINKTSVNKKNIGIVELLTKHKIKIVKIFSPEHGFAVDKDELVKDSKIGQIPIVSLYGKKRKADENDLTGIDIVVYDIVDVGTRYYTYISTLAYMMEAVSAAKKEIVVIDRPPVVGGEIVSGFVPPKELTGFFTSIFPIPTRYGMSIGELALLFNEYFKLNAKLKVIKMGNYSRNVDFSETHLPWNSPSPNLNSVESAILYSELGWLETVNLSMGRGTETPFQLIGAPFIDELALIKELKVTSFEGLSVEPVRFVPKAKGHKHFEKECGGIKITVKNRKENQGFKLGVEFLKAILRRYPKEVQLSKEFGLMTGSSELEALIQKNVPFETIEKKAKESRKEFEKIRKKYLIYK